MDNIDTAMTFSIDKEREEYHLKKKKRKMVKLFIAFVVWVTIVTFLVTPFATYKMMHVNGNVYLTETEVLEYAGIKDTWWWVVDSNKVKSKLESHENIDNVSLSFNFEGLHISILEKYPLAKRTFEGKDYYIMNTKFDPVLVSETNYDIEKLIDITDIESSVINDFAKQYSNVRLSVREYFYKLEATENDRTVVLKGRFNENCYFNMEINIDEYFQLKLENQKINNIKEEILGKMARDNVKYGVDNPIYVRYNLTNIDSYKIS